MNILYMNFIKESLFLFDWVNVTFVQELELRNKAYPLLYI